MSTPDALGVLVRTDSPRATAEIAAAGGYTPVTSVRELGPDVRAIVDLDAVPLEVAIDIGGRFRGRGARLTVAARPGQQVHFDLRRNLAHGA